MTEILLTTYLAGVSYLSIAQPHSLVFTLGWVFTVPWTTHRKLQELLTDASI
jgi:hypothetical protein